MNARLRKLVENAGEILLAINIGLALILFVQTNPLDWRFLKEGYEGSSQLVDAEQDAYTRIVIHDPDSDGVVATLKRGEKLTGSAVVDDTPEEERSPIYHRVAPQYKWTLQVDGPGSEQRSYRADPQRVREFFSGLSDLRDYYEIDRTPELDVRYQMGTDSRGEYDGLRIELFESSDGSPTTIYVGRSSASGNNSYIRLDSESFIYQVERNIRTLVGSGEPQYFRNREIMPSNLTGEIVNVIEIARADGSRIELMKQPGGEWQMNAPVSQPIESEMLEPLLSDLVDARAAGFPAEVPEDLDRSYAGRFTLRYKEEGDLTTPQQVSFQVEGLVGYNTFLLRDEDGELIEVSSSELLDLYQAETRLVGRPTLPGF